MCQRWATIDERVLAITFELCPGQGLNHEDGTMLEEQKINPKHGESMTTMPSFAATVGAGNDRYVGHPAYPRGPRGSPSFASPRSMDMALTRRQFLHRSAAAAAVVALPQVAAPSVIGANDVIRVGVVGCGNRGNYHIDRFSGQEGVVVAAVCDPDRQRLAAAAARIKDKFRNEPAQYADVREMLDKAQLDAVAVATMQYWHALPTIWACQAGKDVYVEKPLSHFIREGQLMVRAARKYNRLVQIGTQSRSTRSAIDTIRHIQDGQLGKIQYVTAFANKPRTSIGKRDTPLPIPDFIDYDRWCGPADNGPIYRDRLQYDCSFTWDKGDGESCNQGVHEIDVARWLLNGPELPRRVISIGGRFVFDDIGDVPNTQIIYYDFPSAPVLYEVHNLRAAKGSDEVPTFRGSQTDVCAQCEGGYAFIRSGQVYDNQGQRIKTFGGGEDIFENFIRAVRSRRQEDLNADILEGHRSTTVTHLGNISYRMGKPASQGEIRERIAGITLVEEMFDRLVKHLKAHEIDVDAPTIMLGQWLDVDTENERFQNHDQANALVGGSYRAPYLLPDEV
jgi:predicted dehydrogenase